MKKREYRDQYAGGRYIVTDEEWVADNPSVFETVSPRDIGPELDVDRYLGIEPHVNVGERIREIQDRQHGLLDVIVSYEEAKSTPYIVINGLKKESSELGRQIAKLKSIKKTHGAELSQDEYSKVVREMDMASNL
ncbi:MAG: hypothetical protein FWE45_05315 [Firmicutes bacterium]|nr:hypothetical protein [Bacillota bacterium]